MRTNVKVITPVFTHEGAPAVHANPKQQLRRAVMACLLWEKQFYRYRHRSSQSDELAPCSPAACPGDGPL
jgi:hypothetical protein